MRPSGDLSWVADSRIEPDAVAGGRFSRESPYSQSTAFQFAKAESGEPGTRHSKPSKGRAESPLITMMLRPISHEQLPGWHAEAFEGAIAAFLAVPPDVMALHWSKHQFFQNLGSDKALAAAQTCCEAASALSDHDPASIRRLFERLFVPFALDPADPQVPGLVTGYYEPHVAADRQSSLAYTVPLYRRPPDLINLVDEAGRALGPDVFTHARKVGTGQAPYWTRGEIEDGALSGKGLELAYLSDPVEAFFLHIQGSGKLVFPDGAHQRVTYDGKNGHPYTSIGAELIADGDVEREDMTLAVLADWLRRNPQKARATMQRNRSFVFFRALEATAKDEACGVLDTSLHPLRSLAVDTAVHALGAPVFVDSDSLMVPQPETSFSTEFFRRLMFAHDVGSAIKGPHRGDIYFGSGLNAGDLAGSTKHAATLYPLLPRALVEAVEAAEQARQS